MSFLYFDGSSRQIRPADGSSLLFNSVLIDEAGDDGARCSGLERRAPPEHSRSDQPNPLPSPFLGWPVENDRRESPPKIKLTTRSICLRCRLFRLDS